MDQSREGKDYYDPSTLKRRICVKDTPPNANPQELKKELSKHFSKYGKIFNITCTAINNFIQFETEEAASCAIQMENNTTFMGCIIRVFPARPPVGGDLHDRDRSSPNVGRSRSPRRGRSPPNNTRNRSPMRGRSPPRDDWRPRFHDDYSESNQPYYPPAPNRFAPVVEPPPPAAKVPKVIPNPSERLNDCEILVFNKANTLFAESIERKLKNLGLSADILFPNAVIPIPKLLGNIASRGTLYAISVSPVNEVKQSFTVNILQGDSEEHRNVPFDQGINLITINFDKFIQNGGSRTAPAVVPNVGSSGPSIHPDAIQTMINLLLQKRPLTVIQYDALIKYLDTLKGKQAALELGDALPVTMSQGPTDDLLKNKIMSIMDMGKSTQPSTLPQPAQIEPDLGSAKPILQDPNIQRALDALLSGGSFNFLNK